MDTHREADRQLSKQPYHESADGGLGHNDASRLAQVFAFLLFSLREVFVLVIAVDNNDKKHDNNSNKPATFAASLPGFLRSP